MLLEAFAFILFFFPNEAKGQAEAKKVLLISLDGFRFDLLNKTLVPSMYRWAEQSTWFINGVRSQYATITAPNHMGIVTGLYNENHGIVGNRFYDMEHHKQFDYYNYTGTPGIVNASLDPSFYTVDPIWNLNERSNDRHRSSVFYWPFAEAKFPLPPHKPANFRPWEFYGNLTNWLPDVDRVVNEFNQGRASSNLVVWYVEEPDHCLHANGFYNGELEKVLTELDILFSTLLRRLEENGLRDNVNIIMTADHGHAQVFDYDHYMCLRDFLPDDTLWGDQMIYPRNESEAKFIYKTLKEAVRTHKFQVKVYLKENFPERYRYKGSPHTARIILEPEIGSVVSWCKSSKFENRVYKGVSMHGMSPDHPEMRSLLLMGGPDFKPRQKISEIPENLDIYPLMCHLLDLKPSPNNGTLEIVGKALKNPPS